MEPNFQPFMICEGDVGSKSDDAAKVNHLFTVVCCIFACVRWSRTSRDNDAPLRYNRYDASDNPDKNHYILGYHPNDVARAVYSWVEFRWRRQSVNIFNGGEKKVSTYSDDQLHPMFKGLSDEKDLVQGSLKDVSATEALSLYNMKIFQWLRQSSRPDVHSDQTI